MKKILFILLVSFLLIECNKNESENEYVGNKNLNGFWKQENSGKYILEFRSDSKIGFYSLIINDRYSLDSLRNYNILSNTSIVINNKNLFYKIEKGELTIYDENKDVYYKEPFVQCEKPDTASFPNLPVKFDLNLNLQDTQLNAGVGAYEVITKQRLATDRLGYGGLLIVNGIGANPTVNLYAYDLACPNENDRTLIVPQNTSQIGIPLAIMAKCPKCGAVFNIIDGNGTPQSGTKLFLKTYKVTSNGTQYIITN